MRAWNPDLETEKQASLLGYALEPVSTVPLVPAPAYSHMEVDQISLWEKRLISAASKDLTTLTPKSIELSS